MFQQIGRGQVKRQNLYLVDRLAEAIRVPRLFRRFDYHAHSNYAS